MRWMDLEPGDLLVNYTRDSHLLIITLRVTGEPKRGPRDRRESIVHVEGLLMKRDEYRVALFSMFATTDILTICDLSVHRPGRGQIAP